MKCCNNDCEQGRNCPAREPVGWRNYLPDLAYAMLLCIAVMVIATLIVTVLHA